MLVLKDVNSFDVCMNAVLFIAGAILTGLGLGWLGFHCRQKRKLRLASMAQMTSKEIQSSPSQKGLLSPASMHFTKSIPSYPSSKSDFGRDSSYFGVQVFEYAELEEATNKFDPSKELGDGGFGTVYYGMYLTLHHEHDCIAFSLLFTENYTFLSKQGCFLMVVKLQLSDYTRTISSVLSSS